MVLTGVICEYNPFHSGHGQLLSRLRENAGADSGIVCVMGGDFVQRGEPAIMARHSRAEAAVRCGADLVLELPLPWACASAERFATAGVAILDGIGVDLIGFGSECADAGRIEAVARVLMTGAASELIGRGLREGLSYPAARERAVRELMGDEAELLRSPNNILAVEYVKAVLRRGSAMRPVTAARTGAMHDGDGEDGTASASQIRRVLLSGGEPWCMPEAALEVLRRELRAGRAPVDPKSAEPAVMARLRTMSDEDFRALPDSGEGLWMRFARFARSEPTLEAVLAAVKTKRYAHARLRRMAMAAYLGIRAEDLEGEPPYLRVLAMGERGREIMRLIKGRCGKPIIVKPASARLMPEEARRIFNLQVRAGDLYALLYPDSAARTGGGEWRATPFMV